jgi:hypothetical protein
VGGCQRTQGLAASPFKIGYNLWYHLDSDGKRLIFSFDSKVATVLSKTGTHDVLAKCESNNKSRYRKIPSNPTALRPEMPMACNFVLLKI